MLLLRFFIVLAKLCVYPVEFFEIRVRIPAGLLTGNFTILSVVLSAGGSALAQSIVDTRFLL